MNVWVVRAGGDGGLEEFVLQEGIAAIGYGFWRSVADFADVNELRECLSSSKPAASARQVSTAVGQLWRFANEIENGDMVVLPRKKPRVVAVGRVAGGYLYRPDCPYLADTRVPHIRSVDWRVSDVPRPNFDQDLLSSFGGRRTVFRVNIDNAASRIERVVNAHLDGQPAIESEPQTLI